MNTDYLLLAYILTAFGFLLAVVTIARVLIRLRAATNANTDILRREALSRYTDFNQPVYDRAGLSTYASWYYHRNKIDDEPPCYINEKGEVIGV